MSQVLSLFTQLLYQRAGDHLRAFQPLPNCVSLVLSRSFATLCLFDPARPWTTIPQSQETVRTGLCKPRTQSWVQYMIRMHLSQSQSPKPALSHSCTLPCSAAKAMAFKWVGNWSSVELTLQRKEESPGRDQDLSERTKFPWSGKHQSMSWQNKERPHYVLG